MAPSVTSCISNAFCSHKQLSWLLVATLTPFFLPFLLIALPLLLLFLAPVSCLLVFLLLLYKVHVSIWSKRRLSDRQAHKGALDEGHQPTQQIEAPDRCDSQRQDHAEEEGRWNGVKGPALAEEGGEERFHGYSLEELKTEETHDTVEGRTLEEGGEGRTHEYFPQKEELYSFHSGDSSSSDSARVQESLGAPKSHGPERERKEEKEMTEEGLKTCVSTSPPSSSEDESRTSVHGQGSVEERQESVESSHTEPLEEAWRELPAKETTEAALLPERADDVSSRIVEKPFTDLEIPQEQLYEEAESSAGKEMPDQKGGGFSQAESTDRSELEEGEQSLSAPERHWPWQKEEAMTHDRHASRDEPTENPAVSDEGVPLPDEEEYCPLSEESSFAGPPPHAVIHGGSEPRDRIQDEQKILADIDAIKKIVGYEGEPHASIMDQISALYQFLGMEPYYWAVEVDDFDKALAEIELLKVVVGVK